MNRIARNILMALSLGAMSCTRVMGCVLVDQDAIEISAREWADKLGMKTKGVTCADTDTDGDWYVSCTVLDEHDQPHAIECGYMLAGGCKSIKFPGQP